MRVRQLPMPEFIAMMALIFATLAFSIDSMLPAFPAIADEMASGDTNKAQLILSFFMAGIGLGTFFTGPISDTFGRLPVLFVGFTLYAIGAALAYFAPSLELLLAARFIQGLGGAAPRIVAMAIIRDLFEGRRMAQVTSFVMTVFMLFPAFAPFIGQFFIDAWGWRSIFLAYVTFAIVVVLWLRLRQAETLDPAKRRAFTLSSYLAGAKDVLSRRDVVLVIIVMSFGFAQMFALLSSIQQIYDVSYGRGATFPFWFMVTAGFSAVTTVLNGVLVMRLGMKRLAISAYLFQIVFSSVILAIFHFQLAPEGSQFWVFFAWSVSLFFMAGLTFGNLNALGLQPLGHLAGMGASLIGAISTVAAVVIAYPISQSFQGTPVPVILGTVVCSTICAVLLRPVRPVGH
jgi:MFS transporter, DHA1 family, multidrug resistance protein